MKYGEIPANERAALRPKVMYQWEILWRAGYGGTVAAVIGVTVGSWICQNAGWPRFAGYLMAGFIYGGLWMAFQEAVLEPRIRKACARMKIT